MTYEDENVNATAIGLDQKGADGQSQSDLTEQEHFEFQETAKLAVLNSMLDSDIANAHRTIKRLGSTPESIQAALDERGDSIKKMLSQQLPAGIFEPIWSALNKRLPDVAKDLAAAIDTLHQALTAINPPSRDFSTAKIHAHNAQLKALSIKESISAESIKLTQKSLDENSRGARLAKHWAGLSIEQGRSIGQASAGAVYAELNNNGLFEDTLSSGDPMGYLFATRLAGELENARRGELNLPMSPDEYALMEKGLKEFMVSFAQKGSQGYWPGYCQIEFRRIAERSYT